MRIELAIRSKNDDVGFAFVDVELVPRIGEQVSLSTNLHETLHLRKIIDVDARKWVVVDVIHDIDDREKPDAPMVVIAAKHEE